MSGGGYIGSWLSGWVFHEGQRKDVGADEPKLPIERVERVLAQDARTEPQQVTWLRNFSNYLTPRVGLLSADTLQGVATFVRNLILTQANLALFLGAVLLLPLALMGAAPYHVPPLANAVLAIACSCSPISLCIAAWRGKSRAARPAPRRRARSG